MRPHFSKRTKINPPKERNRAPRAQPTAITLFKQFPVCALRAHLKYLCVRRVTHEFFSFFFLLGLLVVFINGAD